MKKYAKLPISTAELTNKFSTSYSSEIDVNLKDQEFVICPDQRHGISGFRVLRYLPKSDHWQWDETYQFYPTLEEVAAAINSGDYKAGRDNF